MQTRSNTKNMALVGVMSALVLVFSMVSVQIGELSRFHFGNIMCLLAGLLFGPLIGGLAAGLGSMLYDFTNPLYTPEFWITFITKFAMGFTAGWLAHRVLLGKIDKLRYLIASVGGAVTYVVLYIIKSLIQQHFVYGNPWDAVIPTVMAKAAISSTNAIISVVVCVVFAPLLAAALKRSGLFIGKATHSH